MQGCPLCTAHYTRWEIGGEPQPDGRRHRRGNELYPMGDRGGTATSGEDLRSSDTLYPMGNRGGTATLGTNVYRHQGLYPMGDRGGTATCSSRGIAVL